MSGGNTKTQKAAFIFAFLDALKRDPEMKPRDAFAALFFIDIVGDDLRFYMSARHLADLMRCKESTAEASLGRFRARQYLLIAETPKATSGENGGRLANTYVMSIPDAVSPENLVKTCLEVSPGKSGKTTKSHKEVSPEISGKVSPEKSGTITREKPLEGGRALRRAPVSQSESGFDVIEKDHRESDAETECGSGAHEAPLAASPDPSDPDAWRYDPAFATGESADPFRLGGAPEGAAARFCADEEESYEGRTDDLCNDRIATAGMARAPKSAVVLVPSDDFFPNGDERDDYDAAVVIAEDDLAAIYGDPDVDMAKHLDDAAEGLSAGDPDAVHRFRRDLRLLAQGIHPARREAVLNAHFDIITTFLAAVTGGRRHAEKVVADFMRAEGQNKTEVRNG